MNYAYNTSVLFFTFLLFYKVFQYINITDACANAATKLYFDEYFHFLCVSRMPTYILSIADRNSSDASI